MGCCDENLFKYFGLHDQDGLQAHIWKKPSKIYFFRPKKWMTLKLVFSIGYSSTTKFVQIMTLVDLDHFL